MLRKTRVLRLSGVKSMIWSPLATWRDKGELAGIRIEDSDLLAQNEYFRLIIDGETAFDISFDAGAPEHLDLAQTIIRNTKVATTNVKLIGNQAIPFYRYCRLDYKRAAPGAIGLKVQTMFRGGSRDSVKDYAAYLDSSSLDYVEYLDVAHLRLTTQGTLCAWFQSHGAQSYSYPCIVGKGNSGGSANISYLLYRNNAEQVTGLISNGSSNLTITKPFAWATDLNWHFVAFTWDMDFLRLLLDNSEATPVANTLGAAQAGVGLPVMLGTFDYSQLIDANLNDVRIYNRALNRHELELIKADKAPREGLVAEYLFNHTTNLGIDTSGYGWNPNSVQYSTTPGNLEDRG